MWMFHVAGGRLSCGVRMHAFLCVVHDLTCEASLCVVHECLQVMKK
jgi:hypothetical protein